MTRNEAHPSLWLALAASPLLAANAGAQSCGTVTELGSKAATVGFDDSTRPSLSADGQWLVFESDASNLVPDDLNAATDVFRRHRTTGVVELVSVAASGAQGDSASWGPSVSDDGRYVAFESFAANLAPGDTNGTTDILLKDMQSGAVELVSRTWLGGPADDLSFRPRISADGRFVAFESRATNLTGGTDTGNGFDVFVRDRLFGTTRLVSDAQGGGYSNGSSSVQSISADGRWIGFTSLASDLVPFDTNGVQDVFVHDRVNQSTFRVNLGPQLLPGVWVQGNALSEGGAVSDDGRWVAFASQATNLVVGDTNGHSDIFVRDRQSGTTTLVSLGPGIGLVPADDFSREPRLSGDGRTVVFTSWAGNLVPGDTNANEDVFARDLLLGTTTRLSLTAAGGQGQGNCLQPAVSRDGETVAWVSDWSYDPADGNLFTFDVFLRGEVCTLPATYCTAKATSNDCLPRIGWQGEAKADLSGGFTIDATQVMSQKPGLLFYGLSGPAAIPFQGGYLCVQPPTRRTPIVFSGGNPPPADCSGVFSIDMDAYASGALGGTPLLELTIPGTVVNAQWWGRDPGYPFPHDTQLSDALEFTVRP